MSSSLTLFRFPFFAMGSPCEIQLYAQNQKQAAQIAHMAIADAERLEQRYSRYRPDSFLSQINCIAQSGGSIEVDEETAGLLNYANTCYQQSDGLFDITSGLLRKAWNFSSGHIPEQSTIDQLLDHVGWHKVDWNGEVIRIEAGMELDFGGIVKEYAADRLATLCWNAGVHHGFVNLGGDIRVIGPQPSGAPWQIGIQHPRNKGELQRLELHSGGVASSGDYERCMVVDGVRYGHILNPKTGWPVQHLAAVTVIADLCVVAGSASTMAMLQQERGPAFLANLDLMHLWIDTRGDLGGNLC